MQNYEEAKLQIVAFDAEDVITDSLLIVLEDDWSLNGTGVCLASVPLYEILTATFHGAVFI